MATLERIRSKAGLLVGVVGIALFAFIIGDFLRSGSTFFRQSKEKIAVVDGNAIDIREFQSQLESVMNSYKRGGSLPEDQQNQVREMVFEEMIGSILISEQSKKTGFAVSNEEQADLIMGKNISPIIQQYFQNPQTGTFDRNNLTQFLQMVESDDLGMYSPEDQQQILSQQEAWNKIKKTVVEQKLVSKFSVLLTSAIVVNSLDAKSAFNDNSVNVDFDYVSQSYSSVPDAGVEVSDAEIAKLYELRKPLYKQERAKVISYISVNIDPSEADFADISARMEALKDELTNTTNPADVINENSDEHFIDAFVSTAQLDNEIKSFVENASVGSVDGPVLKDKTYSMYKLLGVKQASDSIKISQIMFSNMDEAKLKLTTDSLSQVIRSGKSSFADVALSVTNGQTNGDMGWQTEASLANVDAKFANALFEAKVNEPFVVNSSYGTHLVQIVEKTKPVAKYKIGAIRMTVVPSQETSNKLYNNLNQYISQNNKPEQFKSAAPEAGYICQINVEVLENQNSIANIENSRQVIRWAYSNKKGSVSEIFECPGHLIVAAVEGELKAGFRSLSDISDMLKRELINEKKGAKIVADLKAKNLTSLEAYAEAMNSTKQEVKFVTFNTPRISGGIGFEPLVNVKAIASEVGQITEPFAGKNAVYVLSVTAKNKSEQEFNEIAQKQQMNMQNGYRIMQVVQSNRLLKDKAKIEDNRSRFY